MIPETLLTWEGALPEESQQSVACMESILVGVPLPTQTTRLYS